MARLHQVVRPGTFCHSCLHGARAVGCGNTGGHTLCRFDRRGEGGPLFVTVARSHGRQLQVFAALAGKGEADQPPAIAGHEVDRVRSDMVCSQYQITFVFAILFVDKNHDAPGAHVGHDVFNRRDGYGGGGGHATKSFKINGLSCRDAEHSLNISGHGIDFQINKRPG